MLLFQSTHCFNPRSRTGNDVLSVVLQRDPDVSIHVPARGTTLLLTTHWLRLHSFNPRSRTGNDGNWDRTAGQLIQVSIHVPARGTTKKHFYMYRVHQFQSTFPHGERPLLCRHSRLLAGFNPRSRTGNDNAYHGNHVAIIGFNPRSRTGNDSNHPQISFVLFALIYAIIPINSVQRNLQHALLLTSPQNYSANPPGILCSLQTRTTLSLRCLLLKITKNIHCTTS